jgi:DNA repair protein RadC
MAVPFKVALPAEDRPRERLMRLGAEELSNAELIAILLGTGTKQHSVIELAQQLLHHCDAQAPEEGLRYLLSLRNQQVGKSVPGIGEAKLCQIIAALQLGLRAAKTPLKRIDVNNPRAVYEYLSPKMSFKTHEEFVVIAVNAKHQVLGIDKTSEGTLTATPVDPRKVFISAIRRSAHAIILAHNHPSGDPAPSREDREVTLRLIQAGRLLGIEVLDHVVVGVGRYVSFRESRVVDWS